MRHMKLLNLIKNNLQAAGKRFEVVAEAEGEATLYLYDVIDNWYGVDSEAFSRALAGIDADVIHLRINSPGGDVFDARAMATQLKAHPARVIAHVDGLCASAATYLAVAADEVRMADGAFYMIHKGWTTLMGNADDLRGTANLLDKIDEAMAKDYAKQTGLEASDLLTWMAEEKWMDAEEAKSLGFVNEVVGDTSISNLFDLSVYDKAPKLAAKVTDPAPAAKPVFNARTPLYQRLSELAQSATA